MRKILSFIGVAALLFSACGGGTDSPSEEELKSKFVGQFCDGHIKLTLKDDGSYKSQHVRKGGLSLQPMLETCEGKYAFHQNEETQAWEIRFEKSTKNSHPLLKCEGAQVVWEPEKGYSQADSTLVLHDLIEDYELKKDNCE